MSFKRTDELFRHSEQWHRLASQRFEELLDTTTHPKARLLLEFLSERERTIATGIRERRLGLAPKVASTWFQYTPDETIGQSIDALGVTDDITLDELIERALHLHLEFTKLYGELAGLASHPEVQAAFLDLHSYADVEGHHFARNAMEFQGDT